MVTPKDKITSGGNDIIQVVVTRSCDLFNCSNCTQLLPFRRDAMHMSVEVFREALRSLADWPGVIGIFGGNPCSHPRFADLMAVLVEEVPQQPRRGLWTNNLLSHGALVREVFYPYGRFNLNAHASPAAAGEIKRWLPGQLIPSSEASPAWHSAILASYQDLGLTEAEWIARRETCDINRKWSASIMERDGRPYAYFCEVAGSLDGVRGENNGIPATPGWWRKPMSDYAHQVRNCCDQGCGVPLRLKGHLDRDDTYDVTPSFAKYVEKRTGKVTVAPVPVAAPQCTDAADYMRRWTK